MSTPRVTVQLAPYGFPLRLEIYDDRVVVLARDGDDWEVVAEQTLPTPREAAAAVALRDALHERMLRLYLDIWPREAALRELARRAQAAGLEQAAADGLAAAVMEGWPVARSRAA